MTSKPAAIEGPIPPPPRHIERNPLRPYGTSNRQWAQAWNAFGKHVLPWCDDPTAPVSPTSSITAGSKAVARMVERGGATVLVGMWSGEREAGSTRAQIIEYAQETRHGLGLHTNYVRAIDIDFKEPAPGVSQEEHDRLKDRVLEDLLDHLPKGRDMPYRWRPSVAQMAALEATGWVPNKTVMIPPPVNPDLPDSGSRVLLYRLAEDETAKLFDEPQLPLRKDTLHTPVGIIEFQADRCFQVLTGRHHSGIPQLWCTKGEHGFDLPGLDAIPIITREELATFKAYLDSTYPDPRSTLRAHPLDGLPLSDADPEDDPVLTYMAKHPEKDARWERLRDGTYAATCPKESLHTTRTSARDVLYYPEGHRGRARGLACQHTTCGKPNVHAYLDSVGFTEHKLTTMFEDIPAKVPAKVAHAMPVMGTAAPVPRLSFHGGDTGPGGLLEISQYNVNNLINYPELCNIVFSFDQFTHKARYAINGHAPEALHDATGNEIYHYCVEYCRLHRDTPKYMVDNAIGLALKNHAHSSAQLEVERLRHDGVSRLATWLSVATGEPNTPYIKTLGTYMICAIVGRLLEPGLKADITPILYGPPGMRKSTLVERLALNPAWCGAVSLEQRDTELFNKLLGKAVVELPELQGFHSRDAESVKAYLTTRMDNARLPYGKFAYDRGRQFVMIGTTNDYLFLTPRLSLRRFAPLEIPRVIDVDFISANIEQLYAEAVLTWRTHGLPWAELEVLAQPHASAVCARDAWEHAIEAWRKSPDAPTGAFTVTQVMTNALGIRIAQQSSQATVRTCNALRSCGATLNSSGQWIFRDH